MEITVVYRENNKKGKNKLCGGKGKVKVSKKVAHIITILFFKGDCPNRFKSCLRFLRMSPFLYVALPCVGIRQCDGPIPYTGSLLKWGNLISRPTESSAGQSKLLLGTRIKDYIN
jgi:hypothetical protein